MILASALFAVGITVVIFATERYDLRLGGVIAMPLMAIYGLRSFWTIPVFILSAMAAYVGLEIVQRRILLYGRTVLVYALVIGSLVPVALFIILRIGYGLGPALGAYEYIGSIFPGLLAYNVQRLEPERQFADVVGAAGLLGGLLFLGWLFVTPTTAATIGDLTPTVLFSPSSDIAVLNGATIPSPLDIQLLGRETAVLFLLIGLTVAEMARQRWGLETGGLVTLPFVVILTLRNPELLALYIVLGTTIYATIQYLHSRTLLYGRNLLAVAILLGILGVTAAAPFVIVANGLGLLFVGMLAAILSYRYHHMGLPERRLAVPVTALSFVVLFFIARWILRVYVGVGVSPVQPYQLVLVISALLLGGNIVYRIEMSMPDKSDIPPVWRI